MSIPYRFVAALGAAALLSTPVLAATPAEILAANHLAMGGEAWSGKAALHESYAYSGQGMTGKSDSIVDLQNGQEEESYTIGPVSGAQGFDGKNAWSKDPSGTVTIQNGGDQRALAVNQSYRDTNAWWQPGFGGAAVEDLGAKSADGSAYDVLRITPENGKAFEAWFDAKTHLLGRTVETQNTQTITVTYSDYRLSDGVELPGKTVTNNGDARYDQTETLTAAAFLPAQPASVFAPPKTHVADFSIAGGAKRTALPFRLINNHIYADATVDGKGPFLFIFDTGGVNLVTPATAKTLGLKSEGTLQANGAGKGHMQASLTKVQSLTLAKATIKDQPFIVLPLDAMSDVEGLEETGMVGFQTFRRFVTRIDYGKHVLTLIEPAAFSPKDAGTPVPITFNGNTIEAEASYDGIAGNFTIDTGNRGALDLNTSFVNQHDLRAKAPKGVETASGWGIGGPTFAFMTRSGTLDIAGLKIEGPVTGLSTDTAGAMADKAMAGNIGAGILKRFVVTLDYGHSVMYLKPIKGPVPDLDTFDESGLWINEVANGFAAVFVTPKGPADKAGIEKGDVITKVDGKPAKSIRLYDLRRRLRDAKPGTAVTFTIDRGGRTQDIKVTLEDMI